MLCHYFKLLRREKIIMSEKDHFDAQYYTAQTYTTNNHSIFHTFEVDMQKSHLLRSPLP